MKILTEPSSERKRRNYSRIGLLCICALLLLLMGTTLTVITHRSVTTASASTIVGVYVAAGDGHLYKLDGKQGTSLWHIQMTDRSLPAAPAIAGGDVYFGARDGNIYAVNAGTGQQVWHYQTGGSILVSPTVVSNVAYVSSTDGFIYALNAQNGALLWRFDAGAGNEAVVPGSVVVVNGVVYGSSSDQADHSYLFALDARTDTQLWRIEVKNQLLGNVQVANNNLYVNSSPLARAGAVPASGSSVSAYDAQTGTQLWVSARIGALTFAAPVIANDTVYVGAQDNAVYAFNAQTGAQVWRHALGGPIYASPLFAGGVLYVGVATTSSTGIQAHSRTSDATPVGSAIAALNAQSGSLIWQQTGLSHYAGTPLALYGNRLYLGTADNEVYALDITTGSIVWHYQMVSTNPFNNAPIAAAP